MRDFWQDIRYTVRSLRARPSFTITAVLTLALGLGATTAVTSVVYTVVLAPPPYQDPGTLLQISKLDAGRRIQMLPAAEVHALREGASAFEAIGVSRFRDVAISGTGTPERVRGVIVTGATLPMLGVPPLRGRLPNEVDDTPGGPCVVALSHRVWTEHFGTRQDIVGDAARLDGAPCTVAAVMPPSFAFPAPYFAPGDLWLLAGPSGVDWTARAGIGFLTFGRFAPGADPDAASAELDVIGARVFEERFETGTRFIATPWAEAIRDASRPPLFTLLAAATLVLVISCVNVVNLQLARNVDRRAEIATRMALGASTGRLVRSIIVETGALFAAGAAGGLLVAAWSVNLIVGLRSFDVPRMEEAAIDGTAVAVSFGLALVAGLVAALIPALRLSDVGAAHTLRQAGRGVTAGPRGRRFGRTLVSVESALAVVLMAGAVLLLRSYHQSATIDPGFRTANMLHARVTPPSIRYPDASARTQFYQEVHERLAALPGVVAVTLTNVPPGVGAGASQPFAITSQEPTPGTWPTAAWRSVSDTYFRTLGIPLVRGDGFERHRATRAAIVNERFVRDFLGGGDPIGERLQLVAAPRADAPDASSWTIVGVAADAREAYPYEPAPPAVYVRFPDRPVGSMAILAHTVGSPLALAGALREAVAAVDPDQPVYGLRDMEYMMASALDLNRLSLTLLALFAGVALALAVAGIYGVVAHIVGQRLREMGVRLALGAMPADLLRLIVGDCARFTMVGAAAGLALVVAMSGRLESLTQNWAGMDGRVLAGVALVVMAVALVAAYLPARRAASVDPVIALRQE